MSDPITQNSILLRVDSFSHVKPYYIELYIIACGFFFPCQTLLHRTLYYCVWILFPMSDPITQNSVLLRVDSFSHVRPYYTELYITACEFFFPCQTLLHRTLYYCLWSLFPMSDPITQNSILLRVNSFSHVRPCYTELYISACGFFFPCQTLLHRTL